MDDTDVTARAFTEALGAEIAFWRKRRGLTREELAEKAGVSASTLGRVERDGPKDVADTWRLADALGVPFVELVRRAEDGAKMGLLDFGQSQDEPAKQTHPVTDTATDNEEAEAASAVGRLDRRARDTRPTRKRAMQQLEDQAARDERDDRRR